MLLTKERRIHSILYEQNIRIVSNSVDRNALLKRNNVGCIQVKYIHMTEVELISMKALAGKAKRNTERETGKKM